MSRRSTNCPETHASHGGSEGWSNGGCEGVFVTESSALARRRDCLESAVRLYQLSSGVNSGVERLLWTSIRSQAAYCRRCGSRIAIASRHSCKGRRCWPPDCAASGCPAPSAYHATPALGLGVHHRFDLRARRIVGRTEAATTPQTPGMAGIERGFGGLPIDKPAAWVTILVRRLFIS